MRPAKQANRQTCKQAGCLRAIRAGMHLRRLADMQPRRLSGDHAAKRVRDHRQDGQLFAGQAQRGKPDPADSPALGTGGTGSPADADGLAEPPRSRGQFQ